VTNWMIDPTEPVAVSPDGKTVAVGGKKVALADVGRAQALGWLPPAHGRVTTVLTFSLDGRTLASGGDDGTVLLWDVRGLQGSWPPQLVTYSDRELTALWDRLADPLPPEEPGLGWRSPTARDRAIHQLLATPRQAVPLLGGKLRGDFIPPP